MLKSGTKTRITRMPGTLLERPYQNEEVDDTIKVTCNFADMIKQHQSVEAQIPDNLFLK